MHNNSFSPLELKELSCIPSLLMDPLSSFHWFNSLGTVFCIIFAQLGIMEQSIKTKTSLNGKQVTVHTRLCILGLLFILFCNFTATQYQPSTATLTSESLHSVPAADYLAESWLPSSPNNDLHFTVRNQIKVKSVKKSSPQGPQTGKWVQAANIHHFSLAGFHQGARPAYYSFLFHYTLF